MEEEGGKRRKKLFLSPDSTQAPLAAICARKVPKRGAGDVINRPRTKCELVLLLVTESAADGTTPRPEAGTLFTR